MMLKKFLILSLVCLASLSSYAQEGKPAGVPAHSEELQLDAFQRVRVKGDFVVHILPEADAPQVFIQLPEELKEQLEVRVKGNALELAWAPKSRFQLPTEQRAELWVCASELEALEIFGSGLIQAEELEPSTTNFQLNVTGSGQIKLGQLQCQQLKADITGSGQISIPELRSHEANLAISGSGQMQLGGQVKELSLDVLGSGKIEAKKLLAENCKASITGSGLIQTAPQNKLTAHIQGSGKIDYLLQPSVSIQAGSKKQVRQLKK